MKYKNKISFHLIIIMLIVATLAAASYKRNIVWQDDFTLWSDVIEKSLNKARGYNNRGNIYLRKHQYYMAFEDYSRAIEINPNYIEAYNNMGVAYSQIGQYDMAINAYYKAVAINPDYALTYFNRGLAFLNKGQNDKALFDFRKACEMGHEMGCKFLQFLHSN